MNSVRTARWGSALGMLLAVMTACATPEPALPTVAPPPSPAEHTVGELCTALLEFFRDDLGVVDLRIDPEHDLSTSLRGAGRCYVATGPDRVGSVVFSHEANADQAEIDTPGFQRLEGVSGRAWISDPRPHAPLALQLLDSESRVTIRVIEPAARTATGPLTLTDEQIRRTAEFGFEVARTLASG